MPWPDSTDPVWLKQWRHEYYLAHKEHDNKGRYPRFKKHRAIQVAYLKKNGLWPMIPPERRYEVPPNLRARVLAKYIKHAP